ncbi:MAG: hypothetical protein U9Q69_05700 [Nanoarchaeota archaeon]|nr:hypothetical protein [Nanoarchaeota archaeon]
MMFKQNSVNYMDWDEYRKMIAARERLMFMHNTVVQSIRNHFDKLQRGMMVNG